MEIKLPENRHIASDYYERRLDYPNKTDQAAAIRDEITYLQDCLNTGLCSFGFGELIAIDKLHHRSPAWDQLLIDMIKEPLTDTDFIKKMFEKLEYLPIQAVIKGLKRIEDHDEELFILDWEGNDSNDGNYQRYTPFLRDRIRPRLQGDDMREYIIQWMNNEVLLDEFRYYPEEVLCSMENVIHDICAKDTSGSDLAQNTKRLKCQSLFNRLENCGVPTKDGFKIH